MSLKNTIQGKMYEAMKAQNKPEKDAYALLLGQLQKEEIDLRRPLTPDEETHIVSRMVKQCEEAYSKTASHELSDEKAKEKQKAFLEKTEWEIKIFSQFMPKQMSDDEIMAIIQSTIEESGLNPLTSKNRGLLMKNLMPKVKGKADGKQVAKLVDSLM